MVDGRFCDVGRFQIYIPIWEEQVGNTIREDQKFSWHSYMLRQLKTAGYAIIASDRFTRVGGFSADHSGQSLLWDCVLYVDTPIYVYQRINSHFNICKDMCVYCASSRQQFRSHDSARQMSTFDTISGENIFTISSATRTPTCHFHAENTFRYSSDRVLSSILLRKLTSRVSLHN